MDPANTFPPEEKRAAAEVPPPRRRFRLEKLEERIAPAGHYNQQSKWVGGGGGGGSSGSSGSGSSGSY